MTKRCPSGTRKHGKVCVPQVSGRKRICKILDESIKDERKSGFKEYPQLAKKLDAHGKIYAGGMVLGIAEQEKQHKHTLEQIRKSMGCR